VKQYCLWQETCGHDLAIDMIGAKRVRREGRVTAPMPFEDLHKVHVLSTCPVALRIACARYLDAILVSLVYMKAIQFVPKPSISSFLQATYCGAPRPRPAPPAPPAPPMKFRALFRISFSFKILRTYQTHMSAMFGSFMRLARSGMPPPPPAPAPAPAPPPPRPAN
jgi:hypothetical protein